MSVTVSENVVVALAVLTISVFDAAVVTENISAHTPTNPSVYDSATVTESVATPTLSLAGISVNDAATVTESVGRTLICNIKTVTAAAETFGKTAKGLSVTGYNRSNGDNWVVACKHQSGSAGTLASITVYLKHKSDGEGLAKCAIYATDKSLLTNGVTGEETFPADQDGEMTFTFATPPTIEASTDYLLAVWVSKSFYVYFDAGTTDQTRADKATYNSFPNPLVDTVQQDYDITIYGNYVPAADTLHESISLSESIATSGISNISVYDSATITDVDAVAVRAFFMPSVYDSVTVTEDIGANLTIPNLFVYDTISASEYISCVASLGDISVNDNVVIAEYIVSKLINLISTSETVTIAESVSMLRSFPGISVSDAIIITERIWGNMWGERTKEADTWTERTKESDAWTQRTKETDTWTERPHKEGA